MFRTPILIAAAFACLPTNAWSTRFADRWITVNPLGSITLELSDRSRVSGLKGWSLLPSSGFWGEFGAYRLVRDNEHAWNWKVGGFVELFRVGNDLSVAFISHIEFVANPHNNIRFNPRAVLWEEGFLLTKRAGRKFWQVGYFHRCKHDIDNIFPRTCNGSGCERSLIYGSVQGKLILPVVLPFREGEGTLVLRGDVFTIRQDDRIPSSFDQRLPRVDRALSAFGIIFHSRVPVRGELIGGFVTIYNSVQLFGDRSGFFTRFKSVEKATWHGGISAGIAIQGQVHMRLGISYEYLADTSINPFPERSHLVLFSLSILDPETIW